MESIPLEPTMNDFLRERHIMMQKWTTEGNKDAEPSLVQSIELEVESGKITPQEGIARLRGIDAGRIER